jgi:hypothetical protein
MLPPSVIFAILLRSTSVCERPWECVHPQSTVADPEDGKYKGVFKECLYLNCNPTSIKRQSEPDQSCSLLFVESFVSNAYLCLPACP